MTDLIITFDRIGRGAPRDALTLRVPAAVAADPDKVAHAVYRHVRPHLRSSAFNVTVDLDAATVSIEGGRYGRATIVTAAP